MTNNLRRTFSSRQGWAGLVCGVLSTMVVAVTIFFSAPYLAVLVLVWPLLFTLATLSFDRPRFTAGAFASFFVVLVVVVTTLLVLLI